jgi:hypothetical protein
MQRNAEIGLFAEPSNFPAEKTHTSAFDKRGDYPDPDVEVGA